MEADDVNIVEDSGLSLNISSAPLPKRTKKSQLHGGIPDFRPRGNQVNRNYNRNIGGIRKPISEYDSGFDSIPNDLNEAQVATNPVPEFDTQVDVVKTKNDQHFSYKNKFPTGEVRHLDAKRPIRYEQKSQYISSLFNSNPEIPHLPISRVKGKEELLFSKNLFSDLNLHPHLVSCLESRFSVTKLTEVQEKTIPALLDGKDALVKSCTGSGKTLAYAVPIVQKLQSVQPKIQRSSGVYALVILPTRELALQSFDCFSNLTKSFTWIVPGYLIGGEKKKSEKARIRKGINILVTTPGRLLDHLEHTNNLNLSKIEWLVIDEADKLLEQGFEEAVLKIISHCASDAKLPNRQTALLSATLTRGVEKLAGISMTNPVYIDISSLSGDMGKMEDLVVPSQLKQFAIFIPTKLRLVTLAAFIVDKSVRGNTKALIFFCSQCSVDFHFTLFNDILRPMLLEKDHDIKFFKLHGNMKQEDRSEIFNRFKRSEDGILLCTDVAARGLHLPHVDWIVQYSVPTSVEVYVHRVGRTARIGEDGRCLLFLVPSETKFINLLQQHKLQLTEMNMNDIMVSLAFLEDSAPRKSKQYRPSKAVESYATNLQSKFEAVVYSEDVVHNIAKEAFLSYVHSYASYPKPMRPVVPFKMLHLGHVAKSFCLRESPSELGCRFAKSVGPVQRQGKQTRQAQKRKFVSEVSEYGNGFDAWKEECGTAKKKLKKHRN